MQLLIGRLSASTDRIFPPITASLYRSSEPPPKLTPDQQAAWNLILLGRKNGSWRYWLPGFKPNAMKKLELLLHCHRRAIEAELASKWKQADFFWGWLHKELKLLSGDKNFWKVIANQASQIADVAILTDPEWLRVRFITEIIIDTHSAFYNFHISFREARALRHFDELLALTGLVGLPLEDKKLLLGPPLDKYLAQYQQKEQTRKALDICNQLLQCFPEHVPYQNAMAKLEVADTIGLLRKDQKDKDYQQANDLAMRLGINALQKLHKLHPYNTVIFQMLGALHYMDAVRLAQDGQLRKALISSQRALTYTPGMVEAEAFRTKIAETMDQIQDRLIESKEIKKSEAVMAIAELQQGFSDLREYIASAEAEKISRAYKIAHGRRIWTEVSPTPLTTDRDDQALELFGAVAQLFSEPPETEADILTAWQDVSAGKPHLSELNPTSVQTFLKRHLFEKEAVETEIKEGPPPFPQPSGLLTFEAAPETHPLSPPAFWVYWLLHPRLRLLKFAMLFLIIGGGWYLITGLTTGYIRNNAYQQLAAINESRNYQAIFEQAGRFLDNQPPFSKDNRTAEVAERYTAAFVRWFAQLEDVNSETVETQVENYQRLVLQVEAK